MLQFTKYIKKNHGSKHIRYWCYNRYRRNHRARVRTWYDFFKPIPCSNNCYWIFSLKSGMELPTSVTGISFNISLLLLKMYSYSYLPNRGLTRISYTISWICTIYMTVLTLNFLQRNAYAEILCVIIHAYNQCRPSTYVCAIQWIRCWQEILCMFCFSGQKRLQLLPVVWWESLTRETWNEKSD